MQTHTHFLQPHFHFPHSDTHFPHNFNFYRHTFTFYRHIHFLHKDGLIDLYWGRGADEELFQCPLMLHSGLTIFITYLGFQNWKKTGNSLVVQWLGLQAFTARAMDPIPSQGTTIPQAESHKPCGTAHTRAHTHTHAHTHEQRKSVVILKLHIVNQSPTRCHCKRKKKKNSEKSVRKVII